VNKTKIEWCDMTWNPVTGCLHGCEYCYARGIARRFGGYWDEIRLRHCGATREIHDIEKVMYRHTTGKNRCVPVHNVKTAYPFGFDPTFHRYKLDEYKNKSGRTIFVCSMADLFGNWVPDEWIEKVFEACEQAPQHKYIFLTKNPKRYEQFIDKPMPDNMWFGFSQTEEKHIGFSTHESWNVFVSMEPLMCDLSKKAAPEEIKWVIIGAETGNRKDKIIPKLDWIIDIILFCRERNIPVFMKSSLKEIWAEPLIQEFPWRDE